MFKDIVKLSQFRLTSTIALAHTGCMEGVEDAPACALQDAPVCLALVIAPVLCYLLAHRQHVQQLRVTVPEKDNSTLTLRREISLDKTLN